MLLCAILLFVPFIGMPNNFRVGCSKINLPTGLNMVPVVSDIEEGKRVGVQPPAVSRRGAVPTLS